MRINNYNGKATVAAIQTDNTLAIKQHRSKYLHRQIIKAYRNSHPLCQRCLSNGKTVFTDQIHHMIPLPIGTTSDNNLLALCLRCHDSIHELPLEHQQVLKQYK